MDIEDFIIDNENENLVLYERTNQKLLKYNMKSGIYLSEERIGMYFTQFCINSNGEYLLWRDDDDFHLHLYSKDFNNCLLKVFPKYDEFLDMPNRFCSCSDSIIFSKVLDDKLYVLKDKKITTFCDIDFGKYTVPRSILEISDEEAKITRIMKGEFALGVCNLYTYNSYVLFSYSYNNKLNTAIITKDNKILNCSSFISEKYGLEFDRIFCSDRQNLYSIVYLDEDPKELQNGVNTNPIILKFNINKI